MVLPIDNHVSYLPPEIHFVLAQHIHRDDLPNYRLTCKALAVVGRGQLFHTITLRQTLASVATLRSIMQDKRLSKSVQALRWDVTVWRMGSSVRDLHEWTRYCESKARQFESDQQCDLDQAALCRELGASREHWEAYLLRMDEEKAAIQDIHNMICGNKELSWRLQLPSLQKIYLSRARDHNGGHECVPVTRPLNAWRGDRPSGLYLKNTGLLPAISRAISMVPKWRMEGFSIRELRLICICAKPFTNHMTKSIRIECGNLWRSHPVALPIPYYKYLQNYPELESLKLDQHGRILKDDALVSILSIQNTFEYVAHPEHYLEGLKHIGKSPLRLKNLRKLSLGYFDTSSRALLSLLARHNSTLRDLSLTSIWLDDRDEEEPTGQQTWQDVFGLVAQIMSLDNVVLSSEFRNKGCENDFWDFDNKHLARTVAEYMIRGGDFPITGLSSSCMPFHSSH